MARADPKDPPGKRREKARKEKGEQRDQSPKPRLVLRPPRLHTPSLPTTGLMTNSGCDGRTRSPRSHDTTCRAARGSPGPTPAPLASRLLRSATPAAPGPPRREASAAARLLARGLSL